MFSLTAKFVSCGREREHCAALCLQITAVKKIFHHLYIVSQNFTHTRGINPFLATLKSH